MIKLEAPLRVGAHKTVTRGRRLYNLMQQLRATCGSRNRREPPVARRHCTHINHIELPQNINTSRCSWHASAEGEEGRGLANACCNSLWALAKSALLAKWKGCNTTNWHWQLSKRLAHFSATASHAAPLPPAATTPTPFLYQPTGDTMATGQTTQQSSAATCGKVCALIWCSSFQLGRGRKRRNTVFWSWRNWQNGGTYMAKENG